MGPAHFPGGKTEARQTLRQCVCVGKEGRGWGGARIDLHKRQCRFLQEIMGKNLLPLSKRVG